MKRIFTMIAILGITMLGFAAPAAAHDGHHAVEPWQAIDTDDAFAQSPSDHSVIVDSFTADATWVSGDAASTRGTSIETTNLGIEVEVGTEVSVNYELRDGASSNTTAVRLFFFVDGGPIQQVAAPDGTAPESGTLTITSDQAGTIDLAGLVYDTSNGGVEGTVRFTDLMVGGTKVSFLPTPVATPTEPTTTDQTCDEPGTITLADDEGVLWTIDGESVEPGTSQAAPGDYEIVATPAGGYTFGKDAVDTFTVTVEPSVEACPGPPGPEGPKGAPGEDGEDGENIITVDDVTPAASTGDSLPKTGAPGSLALVAGAGLLLMLGTALVLIGRKRAAARR